MTKEEEILYVKPYKRGFATMIDMAITSLIRLIFIQIIGILFINKELIKFHQDFSEKFGVPFSNANQEHILFLSNHDIINVMIFFLIAIILVGSLYHCLLNCSNWSATIGKRICNIVMVTDNGKKLTFLQSASHYVLSMVPWIFIIYIMTFSIQNKLNPYYNEETTRGVFLHWARDKAMQQAQVVKGQTPPPKKVFNNDFRQQQNKSASTARNILQAVQAGDFNNLVLSPKTASDESSIFFFSYRVLPGLIRISSVRTYRPSEKNSLFGRYTKLQKRWYVRTVQKIQKVRTPLALVSMHATYISPCTT